MHAVFPKTAVVESPALARLADASRLRGKAHHANAVINNRVSHAACSSRHYVSPSCAMHAWGHCSEPNRPCRKRRGVVIAASQLQQRENTAQEQRSQPTPARDVGSGSSSPAPAIDLQRQAERLQQRQLRLLTAKEGGSDQGEDPLLSEAVRELQQQQQDIRNPSWNEGEDSGDSSAVAMQEGQEEGKEEEEELTQEELDDRIEEAAGFISVMQDLRPLDRKQYNALYEVWRRIARVPALHRTRLLEELELGAIRGLWKASMSRYVLDDARALELAATHMPLDTFPQEPGQVVTYVGKCEHFLIERPQVIMEGEGQPQPRARRRNLHIPALKPSPDEEAVKTQQFKLQFFFHPDTEEVHACISLPPAVQLPPWAPAWSRQLAERWGGGAASYARVRPELTLTPVQADAGADLTLDYPLGLAPDLPPWDLHSRHLPSRSWPAPTPYMWSPFSRSGRDYVRVAGPGVLVGCGYRGEGGSDGVGDDDAELGQGGFPEERYVYFVLVRQYD